MPTSRRPGVEPWSDARDQPDGGAKVAQIIPEETRRPAGADDQSRADTRAEAAGFGDLGAFGELVEVRARLVWLSADIATLRTLEETRCLTAGEGARLSALLEESGRLQERLTELREAASEN